MNVKIDQESLSALRDQSFEIMNTCARMQHVLVRIDVHNPRVLDRLSEAHRLVSKVAAAFQDALMHVRMTDAEELAWRRKNDQTLEENQS